MRGIAIGLAAGAISAMAGSAFGGYTITQSAAPAPTYSTVMDFDQPGDATGAIATNAYASYGVPYLEAGDGTQYVSDVTGQPGYGWCGTGNSLTAVYGVFMAFDSNITDFSVEFWDPSGPPSFFGGGAAIYLFDNGNEVGSLFFEPAWGGVGDAWLNVTTDGGSAFDEVRILGYGFFPESHADNFSWNVEVPAPGAGVAFGLMGLAGLRRRRA